jgi:hypothetical protein
VPVVTETGRMGDDRLEVALRDLAGHVELPEPSDISGRVTRALAGATRPRRRLLGNLYRPAIGYGMAVALAVALAIVTFSPAARDAVADFLGIEGISIGRGETPDARLGERLEVPGEQVTLEEARARAGFDVVVPERLGDPDETHFATYLEGGVVTLVYEADDDLREARGTGVGALITEFRAGVDAEIIGKTAPPATSIERVSVEGGEGYWITGRPHAVGYLGPDGQFREDDLRLAGNTLIWERGELSLRLEADVDLDEALAIARSMS